MPFDARLLSGISAFSAVAEAGSFVRAAEALGLTQPAISHAIARLESRVGARLLERTTRSVRLTSEGQRFYRSVSTSLGEMQEAVDVVSGSASAIRGRLRVNVDPFFSHALLAPTVGTFLDGLPLLELELVTRDHLGDLVAEGFDLALRFGDPADSPPHSHELLTTRIVTVAAPSYIARFGRPRHPGELGTAAHRVIRFRDSTSGRPFAWEFHRGNDVVPVDVHGRLTVSDVEMLIGACLAGHGIAQIREMGIVDLLKKKRLVSLFPQWTDERITLRAHLPSRQSPPAKVRAFLDFVRHATRAARRKT